MELLKSEYSNSQMTKNLPAAAFEVMLPAASHDFTDPNPEEKTYAKTAVNPMNVLKLTVLFAAWFMVVFSISQYYLLN